LASGAPKVLVTIKPVHSLAAAVMEGVATPELLIGGNQSPHTFSLRPSDLRMINSADLIIWVGEGLETPLASTFAKTRPAAQILELMELPGLKRLTRTEKQHGDKEEEQPHDHHHGDGDDPHIWLSTHNAQWIVQQLVRTLSQLDPAHQAQYQTNGERTQQELQRLELELKQLTAPIKDIPYLVFHDAYGYFEQEYGLTRVGSVTINPERSPGAKHLAELKQRITSQGVRCLFSEPQFEPKLIRMLAEGSAVKTGVLDPNGADLPADRSAYFLLMRNLAQSLHHCLSP
jgi:zinc transport system substrate-binding protein